MVNIDREILLQTLRGYEEVNRITKLEQRSRLMALTDDEARTVFDNLCQDMAKLIEGEDQNTLANYRLQHHLRVREAMVKLAHAKGHESTRRKPYPSMVRRIRYIIGRTRNSEPV